MDLNDTRVSSLCDLIRDSFRVRANQKPVYVDVGNRLGRISSRQHQVVFGRRGSGKSCLLIHFHQRKKERGHLRSVYVQCDEVKTLPYPDLLIRLLITIFDQLPGSGALGWWPRVTGRRPRALRDAVEELRLLLDRPDSSTVNTEQQATVSGSFTTTFGAAPVTISSGAGGESVERRADSFTENKLRLLDRKLRDYKEVILHTVSAPGVAVLLDDFYLIHRDSQPYVVDFLHRMFRDTDAFLKIGTVRHRTSLKAFNGQLIGVELGQDVEVIDLDQTLERVDSTQEYLAIMLNSMSRQCQIHDASSALFNQDGLLALTLASGGVPRDYLNVFVEAVDFAKVTNPRWLTRTSVYKGAGRLSYRTKLSQLKNEAGQDSDAIERVFLDVYQFCIKEKRKTAFLISQDDAAAHPEEHEIIQQLMDFKLIHVIEPDTSAASGRPGRFEAYTLDFALFMEPRLRNIDHVEFWRTDAQRRRIGAREAPTYPLSRAEAARRNTGSVDTEREIERVEAEIGTDDTQEAQAQLPLEPAG